jgi:hypothetical protein
MRHVDVSSFVEGVESGRASTVNEPEPAWCRPEPIMTATETGRKPYAIRSN